MLSNEIHFASPNSGTLVLNNLAISVEGTRLCSHSKGSYVSYDIVVSTPNRERTWKVIKRYREFRRLFLDITAVRGRHVGLSRLKKFRFPHKTIFCSDKMIEHRKLSFGLLLELALRVEPVTSIVSDFLDVSSNLKGFQCKSIVPFEGHTLKSIHCAEPSPIYDLFDGNSHSPTTVHELFPETY
mmetsp:Transcript_5674/g.8607  ORF Transcript_5674/g.8607 Transcript_5674/m.8607 type:complete len:184 (-) Transcript_5674:120-671(-)